MMMLLQHLRAQFISSPEAGPYWIAYSGGLDSHVLLHAMVQLRRQHMPELSLQAVHVHHGLSSSADSWVTHCRTVCAALNVEFHVEYIRSGPLPGASIEAWAREARYQLLTQKLAPGAALLTAHTQDDQAETVLLQLLRGAGPKGLAAMPQRQILTAGCLLRPLLNLTRQQLQDYALQQDLSWIEDESNADARFDRNFLRLRVLPLLRARWPAAVKNIARCAVHCAEAAEGLADLAQQDLASLTSTDMPVALLQNLPPPRQRNALRHWLADRGCHLPNRRQMQRIQQDMLNSRVDAQPQITWGHWVLRRFREELRVTSSKLTETVMPSSIPWNLEESLGLPGHLGRLTAVQKFNGGISLNLDPSQFTIRFRRGGERCQPAGKVHTYLLKKLFQEWKIPPWERDTVPLLYYGEQLAAVIGYCICAPFAAPPDTLSWAIELIKSL